MNLSKPSTLFQKAERTADRGRHDSARQVAPARPQYGRRNTAIAAFPQLWCGAVRQV